MTSSDFEAVSTVDEDEESVPQVLIQGVEEDIKAKITVDEALERMGGFGRFQLLMNTVMGWVWFVYGINAIIPVFYLAFRDGEPIPGSLSREFNLVGDKAWLGPLSTSLFFSGWLVGAFVFGWISDKWGRKTGHVIGAAVCIASVIVSVSASSYFVFVAARTVTGIAVGGQGLCAWVLAAEFWAPKSRTTSGCLFQIYWGVGAMVAAPLAYVLPNWRHLMLASSLPIVLMFLVWMWVPESPRWYLVADREYEAMTVLRTVARTNKKLFPPEQIVLSSMGPNAADNDDSINAEGREGFVDLFRGPKMRLRVVLVCLAWFTTSFVYYGLSLFSGHLSGNLYLNETLQAAVESPAYIISIFFLRKSRRWSNIVFLLFAGVMCLGVLVQPPVMVQTVLALTGKMGISASFAAIYVWGTELFPTSVRSSGIGFSSVWARVGGIMAPIFAVMGRDGLIVWGIASFVTGLLMWFLPETVGKTLPDTVEEVEGK